MAQKVFQILRVDQFEFEADQDLVLSSFSAGIYMKAVEDQLKENKNLRSGEFVIRKMFPKDPANSSWTNKDLEITEFKILWRKISVRHMGITLYNPNIRP